MYKGYPVVRLVGRIESREMHTTERSLNLTVCWNLTSAFKIPENNNARLDINIILDPRLRFSHISSSNTTKHNATANLSDTCLHYTAILKLPITDNIEPFDLTMTYAILNEIPNSEGKKQQFSVISLWLNFKSRILLSVFCATCVLFDPNDCKEFTTKVPLNTGCASKKCVANLKLTSTTDFSTPYILGNSKTMIIEYEIKNFGETAFLTQLLISIPKSLSPMKFLPPGCRLQKAAAVIICDINDKSPLYNNDSADLKLTLNTTNLQGNTLNIIATVRSNGNESNVRDNYVNTTITLAESSDIEILG